MQLSDSLLGETLEGAVGGNSVVVVIVRFQAGSRGFAMMDPSAVPGLERLRVDWLQELQQYEMEHIKDAI